MTTPWPRSGSSLPPNAATSSTRPRHELGVVRVGHPRRLGLDHRRSRRRRRHRPAAPRQDPGTGTGTRPTPVPGPGAGPRRHRPLPPGTRVEMRPHPHLGLRRHPHLPRGLHLPPAHRLGPARTGAAAMTALLTADTCPACRGVHGQPTDWPVCPDHGHWMWLAAITDDGFSYRCQAPKCPHTHTQPERATMTTTHETT